MSWVKLDTGFFRNPKVMRARPQTQLLFLATLCWAGEQATDGHVSEQALRRVAAELEQTRSRDRAAELVELGLWEKQPEGWLIHDYLDWQASSDDRSHQRERNRVKAERNRQRAASNRVTNPVGDPVTNPVGNRSVTGLDVEVERDKRYARPGSPDRAGLEAEFAAWYQAYPRKRERKGALTRYLAVRRSGVPAADLLTAAERYAEQGRRTGRPAEMTKHPASFLNNGWEDWVPGGAADQEARSAVNGQRPSWEVPVIEP